MKKMKVVELETLNIVKKETPIMINKDSKIVFQGKFKDLPKKYQNKVVQYCFISGGTICLDI